VCTQIHDAKDDIMAVRLEGNKLFIETNESGNIKLDPQTGADQCDAR